MASAFISYWQNVGPNQVQAPANKISDATPLAISASHAEAPAVTQACLAEISCDSIMNITSGKTAVATITNGQRLPANAFGYFLWLNVGENISVVANT